MAGRRRGSVYVRGEPVPHIAMGGDHWTLCGCCREAGLFHLAARGCCREAYTNCVHRAVINPPRLSPHQEKHIQNAQIKVVRGVAGRSRSGADVRGQPVPHIAVGSDHRALRCCCEAASERRPPLRVWCPQPLPGRESAFVLPTSVFFSLSRHSLGC